MKTRETLQGGIVRRRLFSHIKKGDKFECQNYSLKTLVKVVYKEDFISSSQIIRNEWVPTWFYFQKSIWDLNRRRNELSIKLRPTICLWDMFIPTVGTNMGSTGGSECLSKYIKLVRATMMATKRRVKIGNKMSQSFQLRQDWKKFLENDFV